MWKEYRCERCEKAVEVSGALVVDVECSDCKCRMYPLDYPKEKKEKGSTKEKET